MNKEEAIAQFDADIAAAKSNLYQAGADSVPQSPGGPSEEEIQGRIDEAVKSALDADSVLDAEEIAKLQAEAQSKLDALMAEFSSLQAKEQLEAQAVQGLQGSVASLQSVLDALKALLPSIP